MIHDHIKNNLPLSSLKNPTKRLATKPKENKKMHHYISMSNATQKMFLMSVMNLQELQVIGAFISALPPVQ
jgi:hypothetical protein